MTGRATPATLLDRLGGLAVGRPGAALGLWGDPGVGKTWTARRLLGELPCRGASLHAAAPPAALVAALPRPARLPVWAERGLERLVRGELEPPRAADALAALLAGLAPFVLHVEDLHEASGERLALWSALAGAVGRGRGTGLLATSRLEPPEPFEAARLEPLDKAGSDALLQSEANAGLPPEALGWVFERARGNPLYTLEFFRHLARQGHLWSDGKRWRWREPPAGLVPATVEALIAQLLQAVSGEPELEATLAARAVLGLEASPELWAAVASLGPGALEATRTRLERRGVLRGQEFAHPLFGEVARAGLPPERKRALARCALLALEPTDPEGAVAFVEEAGLDAFAAVRRLEEVAATATGGRRGGLLARAVALASGRDRGRLALEAARALRDARPGEAARLAELAAAAEPENAEAVLLAAELLAGLHEGERAERLLLGLPEPVRSPRWELVRLQALIARGDLGGALALWEARPELQARAELRLRCTIFRALVHKGRQAEARAAFDAALAEPGLRPLDRAVLLESYALLAIYTGDFAGAEVELTAALEALAEAGYPADLGADRERALHDRGITRYGLGRFWEGIADLEAFIALRAQTGDGQGCAQGQANLGLFLTEVGAYDRAEEVLLESRAVLERAGNPRFLVAAEEQLTNLYLEWNPPHAAALALKHAAAAERHARRAGAPPNLAQTLCFVARAEARHGRPERALELAAEVTALAAQAARPHFAALSDWLRGLALEGLGQTEAARDALARACAELASLGHLVLADRVGLDLDRLTNDTAAAAGRVLRLESVGSTNGVNIARRYFPDIVPSSLAPQTAEPALRLAVLGPLRLERGGRSLEYRAAKGRELLAVLLEARLAGLPGVARLELMDALYAELDEPRAAAALQQLVHRVRASLGTGAVATAGDGYALGAGVASDAEVFLESGDTRLWRGRFLADAGEGRDAAVRGRLHAVLEERAEALLESDTAEAARIGRLLVASEPYDRGALRLACRALARGRNPLGLEKLYREGRARLLEVGEALPETAAGFLAASV